MLTCFYLKPDPAIAVTGRHWWKNHSDLCALPAFSLMDQIIWLMLFPAPFHLLNLIIIRQPQPHALQQPWPGLGHRPAAATP